MERDALGAVGEKLAEQELIRLGFVLLRKNYRWNRGEIDLIMRDHNSVVFVEVKTRNTRVFGEPYSAVTRSKQKQIIRVANAFIQDANIVDEVRFDVVSILWNNNHPEVLHIENAFYPSL